HNSSAQALGRTEVRQLRLRDRGACLVYDHWRGGLVLRRSVEEGLLNAVAAHLPEDDTPLRDEVAVTGAQVRTIPPLVGELDFAAEDGGVLAEGEMDENLAAGRLEDTGQQVACGVV